MTVDPTSLDRLHDIVVPPPVPWWPPSPAWYCLFAFAAITMLLLLLSGFVRWQRNRYRREALSLLTHQHAALMNVDERPTALLAVSVLLKRTALSAFPREQVATLTGENWFAFLDRTARGTHFRDGTGAVLEKSVYDPRTAAQMTDETLNELTTMIRCWIKTHSVDANKTIDDPC